MRIEFLVWHILLWLGAAAYIAAAITYGVLAPWYRSHTGRRLMFAITSTGTSLGMVALYTLHAYGDPHLELDIIYGLFSLSGLGLCATFLRQQLKSRKTDEVSLRDEGKTNV